MATWASQERNEPLRGYFSALPWSGQLQVEVGLPLERVPQVFRDRTLAELGATYPGGVAEADPGARYCEICRLLVVAVTYHKASARHQAAAEAAKAARAAARASGPRGAAAAAAAAESLDVDTVRAQMRADPAFTAAILAPTAAEAGGPTKFGAAAAVAAGGRGPPGGAFAAGLASPSAGAAETSPMEADGPADQGAAAAAGAVDLLGPVEVLLDTVFVPPSAGLEQNLAAQEQTAFLKLLDDFSRR